MKILIDFQDTIGGAPRSMLDHALLLQRSGHDIVAVISEKESDDFFKDTGFKVLYLAPFVVRDLFGNIIKIKKYSKLVKHEGVDVIYANRVIHCLFLSIVSDFCRVPILNARAGGYVDSNMVRIHNDKHYIVYSEENLKAFRKAGFADDHLYLIRNRIPIPIVRSKQSKQLHNSLIITVTGSIKSGTLQGLIWFLKLIRTQCQNVDLNCTINLAGGNILKTEEEKHIFEIALNNSGKTLPRNIRIRHLGWVEDIVSLQYQSHICIGKGRSVIQPAMMGKITFVISEAGTLYRCKKNTYSSLAYYNFSGRGTIHEKNNSVDEFLASLSNKSTWLTFQEEAEELAHQFENDYSTEHAKDKLNEIILIVKTNQTVHRGYFAGINKYACIYVLTLFGKIKRCCQNMWTLICRQADSIG